MIRIETLTKRYRQQTVVDAVSFDVRAGDVHGLLGANGSGKTTTIKCLVGLLRPDTGTVAIDGIDMLRDPVTAKSRFGYLPENQYLYPELSADEYLRLLGRLRGVPDAKVAEHADRFLPAFGLAEQRGGMMGGYSMGMKKKAALAGCLLGDPPLVILDEPTNGLDPTSVVLFKEIVRELKRRGRTVLIASHNLPFVEDLADRMTVIDGGRMIVTGTLAELRARAGDPAATLEALYLRLAGKAIADVKPLFE